MIFRSLILSIFYILIGNSIPYSIKESIEHQFGYQSVHLEKPLVNSPCKYLFIEFLNEYDREQYSKCVYRVELLKEKDSKTVDEAREFYFQHYGAIPTYFNNWFEFAKERKCRINRYDMLQEQTFKFKNVQHANFKEDLESLITFFNSTQLTKMVSKDGKVKISVSNVRAASYVSIFERLQQFLPNIEFVVNTHAQPVIMANSNIKELSKFNQHRNGVGNALLVLKDKLATTTKVLSLAQIHKLSCTQNTHRESLQQGYGLFIEPPMEYQTFKTLPILSWGGYPGCTKDILIPSVYHYEFDNLTLLKNKYPEWSTKKQTLIWRGTTSGSPFIESDNYLFHPDHVCIDNCEPDQLKVVSAGNYAKYIWFWSHRQRLVNHCNEYPDLCDVNFVDAVEMNIAFRKQVFRYFKIVKKINFEDFFNHKFILDVDGNGYSGRFLKLLRGNSLIFSAHYAIDWFNDIVIPFYHYIPIDMSYAEININALPQDFQEELIEKRKGWNRFSHERYDDLNSPLGYNDMAAKILYFQKNDEHAKLIADRGQAFAEEYLREEDMDCYIYRALIEMYEIINQ